MDNWSHSQVIAMLEGGNQQLNTFYDRHALSKKFMANGRVNIGDVKYKTKAALFYRDNLAIHVNNVCSLGKYMGREFSREKISRKKDISDKKSRSKNHLKE